MRVLVTGGSGLIGQAVIRELQKQGHEATSFDLRASLDPKIKTIIGSVMDESALHNAVRQHEAVIHLASILGVAFAEKAPRATLDTIIFGTRNVVDALWPDQRIIFSSSSEVYGDAPTIPTSEEVTPAPKSLYGIGKLTAEAYVGIHQNSAVVRYFNVYGPGQRTDFVLPKFVQLAKMDRPLTLYGSGLQTRAFCHVDDIARGTVAALLSNERGVFNIGNPDEPVTMLQLAKRVLETTYSKSPIIIAPYAESDRTEKRDIVDRAPDISKARTVLGYSPQVTLTNGLGTMLESA